jgi:glutamate-1-semialdehyde 2,1-aminomutase
LSYLQLEQLMDNSMALPLLALGVLAWALPKAKRRLELSRAKHRSLAGHSRIAKRIAGLLPGYAYDEATFFNSDHADGPVVQRRRDGFTRLAALYDTRYAKSAAMTASARAIISDMQFTGRYRVPYQFTDYLGRHIKSGSFLQSSQGVTVTDLDGNVFYDLTGSYGVNLLGYDFYKQSIEAGQRTVQALGPVLGAYHPCVLDNVTRLKRISGLDEVSFHMSGTEAVMQAVRLARYHTGRSHLVRFCGAYHGWWEDVQPGPGNPLPPRETHTLKDMDERSLNVLRTRKDIACVLINPLQALHPNAPAPGDSSLVDSSRKVGYDRAAYTAWLHRLREVSLAHCGRPIGQMAKGIGHFFESYQGCTVQSDTPSLCGSDSPSCSNWCAARARLISRSAFGLPVSMAASNNAKAFWSCPANAAARAKVFCAPAIKI